MKRQFLQLLLVFVFVSGMLVGKAKQPIAQAATLHEANVPTAFGEVVSIWNQTLGVPTLLRGHMPVTPQVQTAQVDAATTALAFLSEYQTLFGIQDPTGELAVVSSEMDGLGRHHVSLQQVYQGVKVYTGEIRVHFNQTQDEVTLISNQFLPQLHLDSVLPQIRLDEAIVAAKRMLPNATVLTVPELTIYTSPRSGRVVSDARLAWMVDLYDQAQPAHAIYVIDAQDGSLIDLINQIYEAENTQQFLTYDAQHHYRPPYVLRRTNDQPTVGDVDVDNAHDFAKETFNYYWNTFGRNSYDNLGGTITSSVHLGNNYLNAGWTGVDMVYGDGFAVDDVVAHELTHAVTQYEANLFYWWQSGALNESFSDIFAVMDDREDWLIGEDLSSTILEEFGLTGALRDMEHPENHYQPGHTSTWVVTCRDQEGVHYNSGIFNKAYYNIATAIGKDKAEQIFYRTLTEYLQPLSTFNEAREYVLIATADFYGAAESEYAAVLDGFNAVGLDGVWAPPPSDGCGCPSRTSLQMEPQVASSYSTAEVLETLYKVRDELLATTPAGQQYQEFYYDNAPQVSLLLLAEPQLRKEGARLLHVFTPGLRALTESKGEEITLTAEMVQSVQSFLETLQSGANSYGYNEFAQALLDKESQIDWQRLEGMTFVEAWEYINSLQAPLKIYLPMVAK